MRHSGVLPDPDLTEYAYALAKADRYQEAIDVLDLLHNPNTPRAFNYRGYATRKLGHTDEGNRILSQVSSRSIPTTHRCASTLGRPMSSRASMNLAREQLSTIEKLCGKDCEYYEDLAEALTEAHAL